MGKSIRPPSLSVRLDFSNGARFGPGKAALLEAIHLTGSISGAARHLNMSYPRASRLVSEMNDQFYSPLIATHQGGASRGGAALTTRGAEILDLYKNIVGNAQTTNQPVLRALAAHCEKSSHEK